MLDSVALIVLRSGSFLASFLTRL